MAFEEIWQRIRQHAGETFYEMGGRTFTYQAQEDALVLSAERALPRRDLERVYAQGEITSLRALKDQGINNGSVIFSILTDPRIRESG
ncbi:MAG: hypothetical protein ACRD35_03090 [Candidatus Acidiferrales bacterium]